ncbi:MAG: GNAT family N-acetyltransferase [Sphingobacteriales bacterium]|nr:MAG: GNAT family N-acetyltransferase [Sphingobacteriales bacterium]
MNIFSDSAIQIAGLDDVPTLINLLNKAYRGDDSKKGWTTEAHLIEGDTRTDADSVKEVIEKEDTVMLKYINETKEIIGCVNLQKHINKIYLGMFAVSPQLQGGGVGKKLLQAAEEYAKQKKCTAIYMTVISVRSELINWYKRHGYVDTGKKRSFQEDGVSGKHLQQLEFIVLEKPL